METEAQVRARKKYRGKMRHITILVTPEMHAAIEQKARDNKEALAIYVKRLIAEDLSKSPIQTPIEYFVDSIESAQ